MNEQTYRKYGSPKNQLLFLNAKTVTTDVLQFVKRLEGDYEINGSFQVTNNVTVKRSLKVTNLDNSLQSDTEINTAKGRVFFNASHHVQLSNSTNFFSPGAIHFANFQEFLADSSSSPVLSIAPRRPSSSSSSNLVLTDSMLQHDTSDSTNLSIRNLTRSTKTSKVSTFAIESNNSVSQLHCLFTGDGFQGKSILSDAFSANVRIAAQVNSSQSASLLFENHDTDLSSGIPNPLAKFEYIQETTNPPMPLSNDTWTNTLLPPTASRHLISSFENDPRLSGSYLFASAPLFAAFDAQRTHSSIDFQFPSLVARNRLEIATTIDHHVCKSTLRLSGNINKERNENWPMHLLFPQSQSAPLPSVGCITLNNEDDILDCTRFEDHHRQIHDWVSYPAGWRVSSSGRCMEVGRNARTRSAKTTAGSSSFVSNGMSCFTRNGVRAHLHLRLQNSDSDSKSLQSFWLPPTPSYLNLQRSWVFGTHLSLLAEQPILKPGTDQTIKKYFHPIHIRVPTSAGMFTWIRREQLLDSLFEAETLSTPVSLMCVLPYSAQNATLPTGMMTIPFQIYRERMESVLYTRSALILGHLSSFQFLAGFSSISTLPNTSGGIKIEPAAGVNTFSVRNDLDVSSMNYMTYTDKYYFRTLSFAKSGTIGWLALQIYDFATMTPLLSTSEGLKSDPDLVPFSSNNLLKVITFPWRAVRILKEGATDDFFVCSFYKEDTLQGTISSRLSFRCLKVNYVFNHVTNRFNPTFSSFSGTELENKLEIPSLVVQHVAKSLGKTIDSEPQFRVPLYSPYAKVQIGSGITQTYYDLDQQIYVLCVDSKWACLVPFGENNAVRKVSSSLLIEESVLLESPLEGETRKEVLQPVKVWIDGHNQVSVLFFNLASVHVSTQIDVSSASAPTNSVTKGEVMQRIDGLLDNSISVFVRWDVDSFGDTIRVVKHYLQDVDMDGEWTRLLTLCKTELTSNMVFTDELFSPLELKFPVMGILGEILSNGNVDRERELLECESNPSWITSVSGELILEIFGSGQLSFDLQPLCPWTRVSNEKDLDVQSAIQVLQGDLQLRGSSRIIGRNEREMVIAPCKPEIPLMLGWSGEMKIENEVGKKRITVAPDFTVKVARIRGHTEEEMIRLRRAGEDYVDERLEIAGDESRPLTLLLCPENTGNVIMGDTVIRNVKVNDQVQVSRIQGLGDELGSFQELQISGTPDQPLHLSLCPENTGDITLGDSVIRNAKVDEILRVSQIQGLSTDSESWQKLVIEGTETQPLELSLCPDPLRGSVIMGDVTSESHRVTGTALLNDTEIEIARVNTSLDVGLQITTAELQVNQEARVGVIRGLVAGDTETIATLRVEGTETTPLELYLCQGSNDKIIMGQTVSTNNQSSNLYTEKFFMLQSATRIDNTIAYIDGDFTCTGTNMKLGDAAKNIDPESDSTILMNALTTKYLNSDPVDHGYYVMDGIMVQW